MKGQAFIVCGWLACHQMVHWWCLCRTWWFQDPHWWYYDLWKVITNFTINETNILHLQNYLEWIGQRLIHFYCDFVEKYVWKHKVSISIILFYIKTTTEQYYWKITGKWVSKCQWGSFYNGQTNYMTHFCFSNKTWIMMRIRDFPLVGILWINQL